MGGVVFDKNAWSQRHGPSRLQRLATACGLDVCTSASREGAVAALVDGSWTFLLVHVDHDEWPCLVDALAPRRNAVWVSDKHTDPRPGLRGVNGGYGFECYRRRHRLTADNVRALITTFADSAAVERLRYERIVPKDLRGVLRLTTAEHIGVLVTQLRSFLEDPAHVPRSEEDRLADVCQVLQSGRYPVATICREMGYGPDGRDALGAEAPELLLLLEWFHGNGGAGTAGRPPSIKLVKDASRQINAIWNALEAI